MRGFCFKKDAFNAILELAIEHDRDDIKRFAEEQLEYLEQRSNKAIEKKYKETSALVEKVLDILSQEARPMSIMEIAVAVGITHQKATNLLQKMYAYKRLDKKKENRQLHYFIPENN